MKTQFRMIISAFVLLGLAPAAAPAQEWTINAYAGRATYDPVSADVGVHNVALGLDYRGRSGAWFNLSGAAPLAEADPAWVAAGLGRRLTFWRGQWSGGLQLGAQAYGYRDPILASNGGGGTVDVYPFVRTRLGAARVEVRSGWSQYLSTFDGGTESRGVNDTDASVVFDGPVTLAANGRYVRAEEGGYPYAGASVSHDYGRGVVWASAGRWFADALDDASWGVGGSLRVRAGVDLWASVRQEASDPIYWNAPRQSWNVGMSWRLDTPDRAAPVPVPAEVSGNRVTIRLPAATADRAPYVAGDFTGWKAVPMERAGEYWVAEFRVASGAYHYAFRTADEEWFVPESLGGRVIDDGMGGRVAVLIVP